MDKTQFPTDIRIIVVGENGCVNAEITKGRIEEQANDQEYDQQLLALTIGLCFDKGSELAQKLIVSSLVCSYLGRTTVYEEAKAKGANTYVVCVFRKEGGYYISLIPSICEDASLEGWRILMDGLEAYFGELEQVGYDADSQYHEYMAPMRKFYKFGTGSLSEITDGVQSIH